MRFYGNLTQTEIGERLGISQMHVSRLLARALTHLKNKLLDGTDDTDLPGCHGAKPERHRKDCHENRYGTRADRLGAILAFAVTPIPPYSTGPRRLGDHDHRHHGVRIPRRGYGWVGRRLFVRQASCAAG